MQTHSVLFLTFIVADYSSSNRISRIWQAAFATGVPGPKDGSYAGLIQEVIVLCGNHTACNHYNILTAQLLEFFNNLRNQCLVSGSQ